MERREGLQKAASVVVQLVWFPVVMLLLLLISSLKKSKKHVVLPREMVRYVPTSHLMSEDEWRQLGVQQSQGWVHYMIHEPEPHILLFRRPLSKE
ncbi:hypothetical protein INR49_025834 [Caranx melampygus]|nr:hypothetical protein INR49_025834 [Caranx melampygus]